MTASPAPERLRGRYRMCAAGRRSYLARTGQARHALADLNTGDLSADNLSVPDTVKKWAMQAGCSGAATQFAPPRLDGPSPAWRQADRA